MLVYLINSKSFIDIEDGSLFFGVNADFEFGLYIHRLRVVPHFSLGIVERAKRERAWGDFHAVSRFACSTIPEEKWGTTRSLIYTIHKRPWLKTTLKLYKGKLSV